MIFGSRNHVVAIKNITSTFKSVKDISNSKKTVIKFSNRQCATPSGILRFGPTLSALLCWTFSTHQRSALN